MNAGLSCHTWITFASSQGRPPSCRGEYGNAFGRGLVDVGSIFIGGIGGAGKAGEAVSAAAKSGKGARAAVGVSEAAHTGVIKKAACPGGDGVVISRRGEEIGFDYEGLPSEYLLPSRIAKPSDLAVTLNKTSAAIRNTKVTVKEISVSAQRVRLGNGDRVAVIGRNMKGVESYAEALGKQGVDVTTFSGSYISNEAHREFKMFADQYDGNIPDEVLVKTQIHAENRAWIEDLLSKGGSIVDIGNPFGAGKSVFYEMEQLMVFGGSR